MLMMMMEVEDDDEEKNSTRHVSVEFEILCSRLHVPCLLLFPSIFLPLSSLFHPFNFNLHHHHLHLLLQPPSPYLPPHWVDLVSPSNIELGVLRFVY